MRQIHRCVVTLAGQNDSLLHDKKPVRHFVSPGMDLCSADPQGLPPEELNLGKEKVKKW
jgi:hypothetical protein